MRRGYLHLLALAVVMVSLFPALAGSPVPVSDVAPLDELALEVAARIGDLDELLASSEKFEETKDGEVRRGFGVLAVVGQAIAEHADHEQSMIQGPALRDAARQFTRKSTLEEARAALEAVKGAQAGQAGGDAAVEHDWAKLINMHPMMEEIDERAGQLNRVIRRPRGKPEEPVHASVIALLTLAMHADTHEVKNPDDIPVWQGFARDYLDQMTGVAVAVRKQDKATAGELMMKATATCEKCHERFRD